MKNFQIFNSARCNRAAVAAVGVAVDDDECAVEGVAVGDATCQIHSIIGELDKGVNARAGGGGRVGHVRNLSQDATNSTKKIIFYFLFFALQVITHSFSKTYTIWTPSGSPRCKSFIFNDLQQVKLNLLDAPPCSTRKRQHRIRFDTCAFPCRPQKDYSQPLLLVHA